MPSDTESSEDEQERKFQAELAAVLEGANRRTRYATPKDFQIDAGRLALSLWRKPVLHRMNKARYENWWSSLPDETTAKIDAAIKPYQSWGAFMDALRQHQRPDVPAIDVGPHRPLWDALLRGLPRVEFDEFASLLEVPVRKRKEYAEDFGKRVTRILKDLLDVPDHRPNTEPSKADRVDDLWLRRLSAYISNFPQKFR
jgi:hypothetical protein